MQYWARCLFAALTILALELCFGRLAATSEEKPPTDFGTALAKAHAACLALWADPVFDSLRKKIPLGGDTNPTFEMLTNQERIKPKDKPVADLAVKTVKKCRALAAPAFALLPAHTQTVLKGFDLEEDAIIAQAYLGKITFGEFNVKMNRLNANYLKTAYGAVSQPTTPATAAQQRPSQPTTTAAAGQSRPQLTTPDKAKGGDIAVHATALLTRKALVVGNGAYLNLPKLANPVQDARAIAEVLQKMGFGVTLVLDASETNMRHAVRKFASESERADISLVFYAGHGAQVNGENYLLPVDMDIARTEADIQLTGLKVDDLVNSIQSNTKVVFLDACRDNPVLYKYVKGRSASPTGLAPASASNLDRNKPGGGIFIAYATDSGSVAFDGVGQHSPFTQALLRNLAKPVSIDDMFSLVTREVRLVTKETQRPYKYASMESIVCLTGSCSNSAAVPQPATDYIQEVKHSEAEDFEIALNTNNSNALESFLQKYPDTSRGAEIKEALARIRRAEFDEWTLFEIGDLKYPNYLQMKSINQFTDGRVVVRQKLVADGSLPMIPNKSFPDAAYAEQTIVYDCKSSTPASLAAEVAIFNKAEEALFHYKWADPQFLNMSTAQQLAPGSVGSTARTIVCDQGLRTPLVGKEELAQMRFSSLSSTANGDGDIYYRVDSDRSKYPIIEVLNITRFQKDHSLADAMLKKVDVELSNYRFLVSKMLIDCGAKKAVFPISDYFDSEYKLVYITGVAPSVALPWAEFQNASPVALLHKIACAANEASK